MKHRFPFPSRRFVRSLASFLLCLAWAAPAPAEGGKSSLRLRVAQVERMNQYPPPPPAPNVVVITPKAGFDLAVITLQVHGSTSFSDHQVCNDHQLIDTKGASYFAVLSKPYKGGSDPDFWDKQVLVFVLKPDAKPKSLRIGKDVLDLTFASR